MDAVWNQVATVKGGKIELAVPLLKDGSRVHVTIRTDEVSPTPRPRKFGSAKGMGKMGDDFEEPLKDFKDYM